MPDMRTILLSYIVISIVCVIVVAILWFQNRKRYAGTGFWLANYALQSLALLLLGLRGTLPDLVSIVIGNLLVILGILLLYMGLLRFVDKTSSQIHNYIVLIVFVLVHAYFTYLQPNLQARNLNVTIAVLILFAQMTWVIFRKLDKEMSAVMRETGIVAILYCLASLTRIALNLAVDPGNDFFASNTFDALIFLIYQALLVAGTFSLVLVVNRRLVLDLEHDVRERLQTQEALRARQKLYHEMFYNHSAMMLLVDSESGEIVEANPAAAKFYGYSVDELQNMTLPQINVLDPKEIAKHRDEIKNRKQTYFMFQHRLASGEIREVEVHSIPIEIEGRALLYSIIHDVTDQKRMDDAVRYRNELLAALQRVMLDLVDRHNVGEILNVLLAEIGKLLHAPDISVDLIEGEDTLITYAATPGQPLEVGDTMRRGEGGWLSWQAIESGEPAILDDYSNWNQRRSLYVGYPIHAIMIVPIKHRNRVVGAINILRNEPDKPFNDPDIYVAGQLAQMVALVLDNANLYAQLQSELIDRRQAEQALRRSEYSLTQAQRVARTGHYEWELDTDTVTWSPELFDILGVDPDTFSPSMDSFMQFAHPSDRLALSRENLKSLISLPEHELEFRIINQSTQGEKFVYLWGETTFDLNGEPKQVLGIVQDISDRKYNEQAAVMLAAFEERQRLARDLHDSVNQSLHSLVLFSETAEHILNQKQYDKLEYSLDRMRVSARQALKEMRLMLYELQSPWERTDMSLLKAIQARLKTVESRAQVDAKLVVDGSPQWPRDWEDDLFGIATEALNNALKHSRAEQVRIHLRNEDGFLVLEVIDDGIGFDSKGMGAGGMGLENMSVRAKKMGGVLAVVSAPGEGTCIRFEAKVEVNE